MVEIKDLYDLDHTLAKDYLLKYQYPWEVLKEIKNIIVEIGKNLDLKEYKEIKENVWVHNTANISDSAYIAGPCIIGKNSEVRQCAFIRGSALVGENCVVGNSCELKNVILFDNVQVPHFNYVGDSILGYYSHMGAGSITSNFKSDKKEIVLHIKGEEIITNNKKIGAMLGDYVEVGCNSVLNPGTIIGRHTNIYPTSCVRGYVDEYSIYKNEKETVKKHD